MVSRFHQTPTVPLVVFLVAWIVLSLTHAVVQAAPIQYAGFNRTIADAVESNVTVTAGGSGEWLNLTNCTIASLYLDAVEGADSFTITIANSKLGTLLIRIPLRNSTLVISNVEFLLKSVQDPTNAIVQQQEDVGAAGFIRFAGAINTSCITIHQCSFDTTLTEQDLGGKYTPAPTANRAGKALVLLAALWMRSNVTDSSMTIVHNQFFLVMPIQNPAVDGISRAVQFSGALQRSDVAVSGNNITIISYQGPGLNQTALVIHQLSNGSSFLVENNTISITSGVGGAEAIVVNASAGDDPQLPSSSIVIVGNNFSTTAHTTSTSCVVCVNHKQSNVNFTAKGNLFKSILAARLYGVYFAQCFVGGSSVEIAYNTFDLLTGIGIPTGLHLGGLCANSVGLSNSSMWIHRNSFWIVGISYSLALNFWRSVVVDSSTLIVEWNNFTVTCQMSLAAVNASAVYWDWYVYTAASPGFGYSVANNSVFTVRNNFILGTALGLIPQTMKCSLYLVYCRGGPMFNSTMLITQNTFTSSNARATHMAMGVPPTAVFNSSVIVSKNVVSQLVGADPQPTDSYGILLTPYSGHMPPNSIKGTTSISGNELYVSGANCEGIYFDGNTTSDISFTDNIVTCLTLGMNTSVFGAALVPPPPSNNATVLIANNRLECKSEYSRSCFAIYTYTSNNTIDRIAGNSTFAVVNNTLMMMLRRPWLNLGYDDAPGIIVIFNVLDSTVRIEGNRFLLQEPQNAQSRHAAVWLYGIRQPETFIVVNNTFGAQRGGMVDGGPSNYSNFNAFLASPWAGSQLQMNLFGNSGNATIFMYTNWNASAASPFSVQAECNFLNGTAQTEMFPFYSGNGTINRYATPLANVTACADPTPYLDPTPVHQSYLTLTPYIPSTAAPTIVTPPFGATVAVRFSPADCRRLLLPLYVPTTAVPLTTTAVPETTTSAPTTEAPTPAPTSAPEPTTAAPTLVPTSVPETTTEAPTTAAPTNPPPTPVPSYSLVGWNRTVSGIRHPTATFSASGSHEWLNVSNCSFESLTLNMPFADSTHLTIFVENCTLGTLYIPRELIHSTLIVSATSFKLSLLPNSITAIVEQQQSESIAGFIRFAKQLNESCVSVLDCSFDTTLSADDVGPFTVAPAAARRFEVMETTLLSFGAVAAAEALVNSTFTVGRCNLTLVAPVDPLDRVELLLRGVWFDSTIENSTMSVLGNRIAIATVQAPNRNQTAIFVGGVTNGASVAVRNNTIQVSTSQGTAEGIALGVGSNSDPTLQQSILLLGHNNISLSIGSKTSSSACGVSVYGTNVRLNVTSIGNKYTLRADQNTDAVGIIFGSGLNSSSLTVRGDHIDIYTTGIAQAIYIGSLGDDGIGMANSTVDISDSNISVTGRSPRGRRIIGFTVYGVIVDESSVRILRNTFLMMCESRGNSFETALLAIVTESRKDSVYSAGFHYTVANHTNFLVKENNFAFGSVDRTHGPYSCTAVGVNTSGPLQNSTMHIVDNNATSFDVGEVRFFITAPDAIIDSSTLVRGNIASNSKSALYPLQAFGIEFNTRNSTHMPTFDVRGTVLCADNSVSLTAQKLAVGIYFKASLATDVTVDNNTLIAVSTSTLPNVRASGLDLPSPFNNATVLVRGNSITAQVQYGYRALPVITTGGTVRGSRLVLSNNTFIAMARRPYPVGTIVSSFVYMIAVNVSSGTLNITGNRFVAQVASNSTDYVVGVFLVENPNEATISIVDNSFAVQKGDPSTASGGMWQPGTLTAMLYSDAVFTAMNLNFTGNRGNATKAIWLPYLNATAALTPTITASCNYLNGSASDVAIEVPVTNETCAWAGYYSELPPPYRLEEYMVPPQLPLRLLPGPSAAALTLSRFYELAVCDVHPGVYMTPAPPPPEPTTAVPSTEIPTTAEPSTLIPIVVTTTAEPSTAVPSTVVPTAQPTTTEVPPTIAPTTTAVPTASPPNTTTAEPHTPAPSNTSTTIAPAPSNITSVPSGNTTTDVPSTTPAPINASTTAVTTSNTTTAPATETPAATNTTEAPTTTAPSTSAPTAVPPTEVPINYTYCDPNATLPALPSVPEVICSQSAIVNGTVTVPLDFPVGWPTRTADTLTRALLFRVDNRHNLVPNPSGFASRVVNATATFNATTGNFTLTLPGIGNYSIIDDETLLIVLPAAWFGLGCVSSTVTLVALRVIAPEDPAIVATQAAVQTATTIAAVAAPFVGAGAALDAQSLAVVGFMSCASPAERKSLKSYKMLAPTAISDSLLGVVVGNWILLFIFILLHSAVMLLVRRFAKKGVTLAAMEFTRFPGFSLTLTTMLFQGTGFAGMKLLFENEYSGAESKAVGFFGVLTTFAIFFVFIYIARTKLDVEFAEYVWDRTMHKSGWYLHLLPKGKWMPPQMKKAFGGYFASYRVPTQAIVWFPLLTPLLFIIVGFARPQGQRGCAIQLGFLSGLLLLVCIFLMIFRPYRGNLANVFAVASLFCVAMTVLASAVMAVDASNPHAANILALFVPLQMAVTITRLILGFAVMIAEGRVKGYDLDTQFRWVPGPFCSLAPRIKGPRPKEYLLEAQEEMDDSGSGRGHGPNTIRSPTARRRGLPLQSNSARRTGTNGDDVVLLMSPIQLGSPLGGCAALEMQDYVASPRKPMVRGGHHHHVTTAPKQRKASVFRIDKEECRVPPRKGWVWKRSIENRATSGLKASPFGDWKLRYLVVSIEGISYYVSEPFDTPRLVIEWPDVALIMPMVTPQIDKDADDPSQFYFGFSVQYDAGRPRLLLLRCDDESEREEWVLHAEVMQQEHARLIQLAHHQL